MRTARMLSIGLFAVSLVFVFVAPTQAAERNSVVIVGDMAYSSNEYVSFINIFNALMIERLKKIEPESGWGVLILRDDGGKVLVAVIREEEGARPIQIAILDETADFSLISAAVNRTVAVIRRGGREK